MARWRQIPSGRLRLVGVFVADAFDPIAIKSILQGGMAGREPAADLLPQAGGWGGVEGLASHMVDDQWLTAVMLLLARDATFAEDAGQDLAEIKPAAVAMAEAALTSTDPLQFTQGLETMCSTPVLADLVGEHVAGRCLAIA